MPNPFDIMCRFLAKLTPRAFLLWLLLPHTPRLRFHGWLDTHNLPFPGAPERYCDTVAQVSNRNALGFPWLIVTEFQTEPMADMLQRLLIYESQLRATRKPAAERGDRFATGSILVHLTGTSRPELNDVWPEAGLRTIKEPHIRNLAEDSAADTLAGIAAKTLPPIALAFVPLMRGGTLPETVAEWKRIGLTIPQWLRPNVAAGAVVFAELTNCETLWRTELEEWNMLRSKQVDEWTALGHQKGVDEGMNKGLIVGTYLTALRFGQSAEQGRQLVIAEFGANAILILDAELRRRSR